MPPTLVRPARRTLERGRRSPRKGYGRPSRAPGRCRDVGPVRRISSSPSVLCGHPRHHDAIPGTAAPSPTLWEYGTTRHRHAYCCAPYGFPSAAPSSQRTDDDQGRSSHTATLKVVPGRIRGTPRRSARSGIHQDSRLLHGTIYHTATRSQNSVARL
jgi:hypothetical protein